MKTWINDYGDIPWWYWVPAMEVRRLQPRRRSVLPLLMAMAGLCSR